VKGFEDFKEGWVRKRQGVMKDNASERPRKTLDSSAESCRSADPQRDFKGVDGMESWK